MTPTETDFLKYYNAVKGYAFSLTRNHEDADDLTQEVYLRAIKAKDKYVNHVSWGVKNWLFTIARNAYIDQYKFRGRRANISVKIEDDEILADRIARYEDDPYKGCFSDSVMMSLNSLKDRQMIILAYLHDFKYEEIQELTGLPLGTIKSRLFLARKDMQKKIRRMQTSSV